MASILIRRNWRKQPPGAVEPDWKSPLLTNVKQLYNGCDPTSGKPRNYANSQSVPAISGAVSRADTGLGIGWQPVGAAGYVSEALTAAEINAANPWTYACVVSPAVQQLQAIAVVAEGPGGGTRDRALYIGTGSTYSFIGYIYSGGAINVGVNVGPVATPGNQYIVVLTAGGGAFTIYVNGVMIQQTTGISGNGYTGYSSPSLVLGYGEQGAANTGSTITLPLFLRADNYAWSAAEAEGFCDNPWQVWRPRLRRVWVGSSAVATAPYSEVYQPWIKPGVGPNPARIGREFAFLGSQTLPLGGNFSGTTIAGNKPLTGQVASLSLQYNFTSVAGNKPLSGQVATLSFQRNLSPIAGGLVKTGQVGALFQGNVFTTVVGNKPLTGQVATLSFQRNFTTIPGNKPLTGGVGSIAFARNFGTIAGTLTKTGGIATLSIPFAGTTVPGGLVKTGKVASLSINSGPSTTQNFHSWFVKAIGVKTKISVNSQVDSETGDTP